MNTENIAQELKDLTERTEMILHLEGVVIELTLNMIKSPVAAYKAALITRIAERDKQILELTEAIEFLRQMS